jgi:hypothetical protein
MQRELAGEENIRVHRQIHGHVYGCKDDVTLILYDPGSNEHVLPRNYQLSNFHVISLEPGPIHPSQHLLQYLTYLICVYHVTRMSVSSPGEKAFGNIPESG